MKHSLSKAQFKLVFSNSKSLQVGDLLFKYNQDLNPGLGLTVSKKYGNAVSRNLFKRRCRMCFQELIKKDFKYSVIITPKKKNLSWNAIVVAFEKFGDLVND